MTTSLESTSSNPSTLLPLVSNAVPTCNPKDSYAHIAQLLIEYSWSDMDYVFVLANDKTLLGIIDMASSAKTPGDTLAENLMKPITVSMKATDSRQKVPVVAVKHDLATIPIVDHENKFIGALVSKTIIDLMHTEHLENVLLTSGLAIKKHKVLTVATAGLFDVVGYRLPWLLLGLLAGLGLGLISRTFEQHLQENIAIAYFIPVVAYIADSVGTQSEAIVVRSLATLKINGLSYLLRELAIGVVLGIVIGLLGGIGAFVISAQLHIGIVVGLALFVASAIAAVIASAIPIAFKFLGKDPALGSGPLSTALQDIISVVIYFVFVSLLL